MSRLNLKFLILNSLVVFFSNTSMANSLTEGLTEVAVCPMNTYKEDGIHYETFKYDPLSKTIVVQFGQGINEYNNVTLTIATNPSEDKNWQLLISPNFYKFATNQVNNALVWQNNIEVPRFPNFPKDEHSIVATYTYDAYLVGITDLNAETKLVPLPPKKFINHSTIEYVQFADGSIQRWHWFNNVRRPFFGLTGSTTFCHPQPKIDPIVKN